MSEVLSSAHVFRFPKSEHLCLSRDIEALFEPGSRSAAAYPLRVVWRVVEAKDHEPSAKVMFSVPKRHFRHAVDRNRTKRQLREAYRHHKALVCVPSGKCVHMAFLWMSHHLTPSAEIEKKVVNLLQRLNETLHEKS